jgi:hypothetical protein
MDSLGRISSVLMCDADCKLRSGGFCNLKSVKVGKHGVCEYYTPEKKDEGDSVFLAVNNGAVEGWELIEADSLEAAIDLLKSGRSHGQEAKIVKAVDIFPDCSKQE